MRRSWLLRPLLVRRNAWRGGCCSPTLADGRSRSPGQPPRRGGSGLQKEPAVARSGGSLSSAPSVSRRTSAAAGGPRCARFPPRLASVRPARTSSWVSSPTSDSWGIAAHAPSPPTAPFPTKQQIFFVTAPVPQVEIGGNGGWAGGGRCPPPRGLAIRGRRGGGTAPPRCRAPAAACAGGRCPVRSSAFTADRRPALTSPRVRRWARGVAPATFRRHHRHRRSARGRRGGVELRSASRPRRDARCTRAKNAHDPRAVGERALGHEESTGECCGGDHRGHPVGLHPRWRGKRSPRTISRVFRHARCPRLASSDSGPHTTCPSVGEGD